MASRTTDSVPSKLSADSFCINVGLAILRLKRCFIHCKVCTTSQAQTTGWEVTLERQKLRAQALADELGSLIEYAARKCLGETCCHTKLAVCFRVDMNIDLIGYQAKSGLIFGARCNKSTWKC